MFDKFYHLYINNKDIYSKKVVYYTNEWYNKTEEKTAFLNEVKLFEERANNISILVN
jgi:hypothetical protein